MLFLILLILANNPQLVTEGGRSWCYVLQRFDPQHSRFIGCDILVIDYSYDGTNETVYSKSEISFIKSQGTIVYAYLSIGEAEDYRFYWNTSWNINPPDWILDENPEWPGNYLIKYWSNEWKSILSSYLDIILRQGFDGIYLDKIDSYYTLSYYGYSLNYTAREMYRLVKWIRDYVGNQTRIILQNGEDIIDFEPDILNYINGWGIEDLFYNGRDKVNGDEVKYRLKHIKEIKSHGLPVYVIDYIFTRIQDWRIYDFHLKCRYYGLIPYVGYVDRELDEIVRIPHVQPDPDIVYIVEEYVKRYIDYEMNIEYQYHR